MIRELVKLDAWIQVLIQNRISLFLYSVHKVLLSVQINIPRELCETDTCGFYNMFYISEEFSLHSLHFHTSTSNCPQDVKTIFQLHLYTLQCCNINCSHNHNCPSMKHRRRRNCWCEGPPRPRTTGRPTPRPEFSVPGGGTLLL